MNPTATISLYKILNITPIRRGEILAIFAYKHEDGSGFYLDTYPIDALAVCEETTLKHFANGTRETEYEGNTVCGLELTEGWFQVVNEANNFAGLCKPGEDPYEHTGSLHCEYRPLVKKKQ